MKDFTTRTRETTTETDFLQLRGKAARIAEKREAAFAGVVLGISFATGLFEWWNVANVPHARQIIVTAVLFGTIEVPRLEEVSVYTRLILMIGLSGSMLLFIRNFLGQGALTTVAFAALFLLGVASIINVTAQAGWGPTAKAQKATLARHGAYLAVLAVLAIVTSL